MTRINSDQRRRFLVGLSLVALNAWLLLVALPLFWVVQNQAISPAIWLVCGASVVAAVGSFRWRNRHGLGATLWLCLIFPLTLVAPGLLLRVRDQWPWSSPAARLFCAISVVGYLVVAMLCNARSTPPLDSAVEPLDPGGDRPKHLVRSWSWWLGLAAAVVITVAAWWHSDWGSSSSLADRARLATLTLGSLALSQYVLWGVVAPTPRALARPKPLVALLWLAGASLACGLWLALGG